MQQTLRFGSQGPAVKQLQSILNGLPSALAKLVEDGMFGQGTRRRVIEFQGKCQVIEDGIVGPSTWKYLLGQSPMPNGQYNSSGNGNGSGAGAGGSTPPPAPGPDGTANTQAMPASMPANEKAARERIVQIATDMFTKYGGWKPGDKPSLSDPRVAGKLCADPATRARQGGKTICEIFTVAGGPAPQRCLTLTPQAEAMYGKASYTAAERNNTDIVSWCGIFSLYVHKMAGLKVSNWPLRYSIGKMKPQDEYRIVQWPQPGDIGIVSPTGLNHHFVVTAVDASGLSSVDGNAGWYMEIVKKQYSKTEIKGKQGYFVSPVWENVLA